MLSAAVQMLDLLDTHVSLVLLLLLLLTYYYSRRPRNLPPGPWSWPVVGSLPSLAWSKNLHLDFMEWQKKYGPVTYFRMGMLDAVVLGGYDTIRQALVKQSDVFSSRPAHLEVLNKISNKKGIVLAPSGPLWKEQRKFALTTLRSFGFGKRSLEVHISEESAALRQEICNMGDKPFHITRLLQKATTNIICSLVFARRFEYDNPQFLQIMQDFDDIAGTNFLTMPENIFPFLTYVLDSGNKAIEVSQRPIDFVRAQIKEHQRTLDPNDIRDFIDAYLLEMKAQDQSETTFTEEQLIQTVTDLFLAGTETTSTTLLWASLLMILNPDIQQKVQEEIDSVLGQGQTPSMSHRDQLPYTQAVLTEVARFATIVPLNVPHTTTEDTTLNGYHIPKQTMVIPSIWSVHHDEKLFPQHDKFDPSRFLDEKGQYKKDDHVMPFSAGPRICLGEQLARMELFLFFTSLMQHFTFKIPKGAPTPSLVGRIAATHAPEPFDIVAVIRD
ncbi:PREDICTED: cytochrome P450 2C15-like [Branchiostoma belcheri]|uniref:Cytochrome P450 2U1 n=1 Tax=Branchiostoma belcheri TaxID=7741 RepID=A0A6P5AXH4_BRABE|nr:PREDICTED: cytochrome P450 2C15-like [Branchiostoma belcheri]